MLGSGKMNICILYGKIISDVEFKFIIKSKNKSVAYFEMILSNNSVVKVKAYDEKADFIYKKYEKGKYVFFEGKIISDGSIEYGYTIL